LEGVLTSLSLLQDHITHTFILELNQTSVGSDLKTARQRLIPLPLVAEEVPVPLGLLHGEASALDEALCYRARLVQQAQTPGRDRPALDGVRREEGRCYGSQETGGVRMGHPARLHGNRHQRQQLVRLWIPDGDKVFRSRSAFIMLLLRYI